MKDILTEEEAKEQWCPLFRGAIWNKVADVPAVNAVDHNGEFRRVGKCIAGQCMAWRLAHKDGPDGSERGYCGAFGQPRFV